MAKTYIVTPNYSVRPPPSLIEPSPWPQSTADQPAPATEDDSTEAITEQALPTAVRPASETSVGTLYLGDILRDPVAAELTWVNQRKDRLPVPHEKLALPPDVKEGFKATRNTLLKGRLGVWTALLTALGLPGGIDASAGFERHADDVISAEKLETQEMELDAVDDVYLNASMKVPSVVAYLKGCRDPPPALYMVTGLKIVHGASVETTQSMNVDVKIGADAASQDILKIAEFNLSRSEGLEFTSSRPFVLAFRARKILYKRGQWEHASFYKGASMMGDDAVVGDTEIQVSGVGEDAVPNEDMIEYDEVCVHAEKDEKGEVDWVVPGLV